MASRDRTGESVSVPTSDHVPELMKAVPSRADIAATAEAVSCDAGAMTAVPASPAPATSRANTPTIVPGSTIGPGSDDGKLRRSIKSVAQERVTAFTICVVVALVNSQTALPVIQ